MDMYTSSQTECLFGGTSEYRTHIIETRHFVFRHADRPLSYINHTHEVKNQITMQQVRCRLTAHYCIAACMALPGRGNTDLTDGGIEVPPADNGH